VESPLPIFQAMELEVREPEECEHGVPLHMFDRLLVPLGARPRSMYCAECCTAVPREAETVPRGKRATNPIGDADWFAEP
jgi:hypothetical protein